jgi:hypothetical protein
MGYKSKAHFTRIRPTLIEGYVFCRGEVGEKEGGKFKQVAHWRHSLNKNDSRFWVG